MSHLTQNMMIDCKIIACLSHQEIIVIEIFFFQSRYVEQVPHSSSVVLK